jgi:hypothetical protein
MKNISMPHADNKSIDQPDVFELGQSLSSYDFRLIYTKNEGQSAGSCPLIGTFFTA